MPKKCVAHLKLNLLCSRRNAKDFSSKCRQMVYYVTTALAGKLLVRPRLWLDSSAKSANIYSTAATSARNVFHYSCCLTSSDIFKAEYCSSTVQQSLVIKILNADLQVQADFAISHSYNTNADYSPYSDCAAAQSRNYNFQVLYE